MAISSIFLFIAAIGFVQVINAGISDKWEFCGCKWLDWGAWSTCSSECNGVRSRERRVWLYSNKEGCPTEFTTCATSDMAYEYSRCNTFCYNGGTSNSYRCSCVTGYYGSCCGSQVNCGHPGNIKFGTIQGTTYNYGNTITYACNNGYILVDGSAVRTCQINHLWSGLTPRCAYYSSCSSAPCQNKAICKNVPDDYTCVCTNGWSGRNCEIDIQPPIMEDCEYNLNIQTSDLTKMIEWKIPRFTDPHNYTVEISSNYPKNSWEFPWGDYNVSYFAIKPNNGLSAECIIEVRVRPYTCNSLTIPAQGAIACNNWKTDYGIFCIQLCKKLFTVPRGVDPLKWHVCGSSGSWIPISKLANCTVDIRTLETTTDYIIADSYETCEEELTKMKSYYINKLNTSPFNYFCDKFPTECLEENVSVRC